MRLFLKILPIIFLFLSCKSRVSDVSDLSVKNVVYYLDGEYVKRLECDADEPTIIRSCSGIVVLLEADSVRKLKNSLLESSDPKFIEELGLTVLADIVREDPDRYKRKFEIVETLLDPEQQVELTSPEDIEFLDRIFHGRATVEVKQVSTDIDSTCALIGNGKVKCWGTNIENAKWLLANDLRKGGRFARIAAASPESTQQIKNAISVANGGSKVCALTGKGFVKCLGAKVSNELYSRDIEWHGLDFRLKLPTPQLKEVSEISILGKDICAIHGGGKLHCWGYSFAWSGEDGIDESSTASIVDSQYRQFLADASPELAHIQLEGVLQIAGNFGYRCALMKEQTVSCWGNNFWGQLGVGAGGNSDTKQINTPQKLGLVNVESIEVGGAKTCAVLQGGTLRCWGTNSMTNSKENINDATSEKALIPLANVSQVQVSDSHLCALLTVGEVICWGDGKYFAQGVSKRDAKQMGFTNLGLKHVTSISGRYGHTCVILKGGRLKCWGENSKNQLGFDFENSFSEQLFLGDAPSEMIDKIPFVFPVWKREGWE